MKDNIIPSKETKITTNNIGKKIRKTWKKLRHLYIEYELSQLVKTNNNKKDHLINIISKTECKYVCYLKKQYEERKI